MKKIRILAICVLLGAVVICHAEEKTYRIGVLVWQEKQDYADALAGFHSAIDASGIKHELDIKRTLGDEKKSREVLREWKTQGIDLIVTFGTMGTKWAAEEAKGIPIVTAIMTNPVKAGLAQSWEKPGRGITGSSNWIKPQDKLGTFKKCLPQMKTLGVMYNPDNVVSATEVEGVRDICGSMGIVLKESFVKDANAIEKATAELVGSGIDALWVPTETFLYQNISKVTKVTRPAKLPVVSSTLTGIGDDQGTKDAGILAVTVDCRKLGKLCVPAVIEILTTGKNPGEIPIKTMSTFVIAVNTSAAADIGCEIPPVLLAQANMVFKGFGGQKIIVGGTGDNQELLRAIAKALKAKLGEGDIQVPDTIGSSGGIKAVAKGDIDLARVARALKKSEVGLGLTYLPFARAPIVFVVHPSVKGVENLTTQQIVGIYSGEIRNWSEVGGEAGKIYPITRESGDASLIVINEKLTGFSAITNKAASKEIFTTPEAVKTMIDHAGTIGFLPMPVTVGTELRIVKVDGLYPSAANVLDGKYGLTMPFAFVYKEEPRGLSKRFIDFVFSEEGQAITTMMGAIPLK